MNPIPEIPTLPKEWRHISNWWIVLPALKGLALFFVGGGLAYFSYHSIYNYFLMWLGVLVSAFFAGIGLDILNNLAHEGGHGNLNKNLYLSYVLGIISSSFIPAYAGCAYMVTHWPHHRFTNTEKDPNSILAHRLAQWHLPRIMMLFLYGLFEFFTYFKNSVLLFVSDQHDKTMRLKRNEIISLVILNYLLMIVTLIGYLCIYFINKSYFFLAIVLPFVMFIFILALDDFAQHTGTLLGLQNSRSCLNLLVKNYHLEHHLFPHVQQCHLPKIHKYLQDIYQNQSCFIEKKMTGLLRSIFILNYPIYKDLQINKSDGK